MVKGNDASGHQTKGGSQLLSHTFMEQLGKYGEGATTNSVLEIAFSIPDGTTTAIRDILVTCTLPVNVGNITKDNDICSKYLKTKKLWSLRKEKTCAYHHHIGHYKADIKNKFLSYFFFQRGQIPAVSGYSPVRHSKYVDLMIMKTYTVMILTLKGSSEF